MNEIQVRTSIIINNGSLQYRSSPTAYNLDMSAKGGPTPGAIKVPTQGMKVDLSQLVTPGRVWFQNQDASLSVEIGVHNGSYFYPLMELGPGQADSITLSRHLNLTETVTGTGTIPMAINDLWVKPLTQGPVLVTVDVFEK